MDVDTGISALAVFLVTAGLATLGTGLRRIPWRYGVVVGAGTGLVLVAVWAANSQQPIDPVTLVLFGAIGGSVTQLAFDRGQRERDRISGEITAVRSTPAA
jgi:hypothetical protein